MTATAPPAETPQAETPPTEVAAPAAPPAEVTPPVEAAAAAEPGPTTEALPDEPPAPTWDTPTLPDGGEQPAAESTPPAKKTAKRAPAKRTAKKVADSEDEAPRTRAPRKRAAKKSAAPVDGVQADAQAQPDLLAEAAPTLEPVAPASTNDIPNPFATPEPVADAPVESAPDGGADQGAEVDPGVVVDEPKLTVTVETPFDDPISRTCGTFMARTRSASQRPEPVCMRALWPRAGRRASVALHREHSLTTGTTGDW